MGVGGFSPTVNAQEDNVSLAFHRLIRVRQIRIIRAKFGDFMPPNNGLPEEHPIVDEISSEENAHSVPKRGA